MAKPIVPESVPVESLLADYADNLPFPDLGNAGLSTMLIADLGDRITDYRDTREEQKERVIQEPYQGGGVSLGASNFTDSVVSLLTYGIVGGAIYYATDDDDDGSNTGFKAVNDDVSLIESGDPVVVNVLANDRPGPQGGELRIVAADTTSGNGIEVTDLGDGEFSLDIGDDYQELLPGDKIKDTFTYTIENDAGEQSTGTVHITINGDIDNVPVVTAPESANTDENSSVTVAGIQVSDLDIGDRNIAVALSADNGTLSISGDNIDIRGNDSNELTLKGMVDDVNSALQTLVYTPDDGFSGEDTLQIAVSDDTSTIPDSVPITVVPDQSQPVVAEEDTVSLTEGGAPVTVNVLENDSFDGDATDLTLTVASTTNGGIAVTNNNDGTLTFTIGDGFTQLLPGDTVSDTVTYTIEDELGQQSSAAIGITVEGSTNDAPINTAPATLITTVNTAIAITGVSINDVDSSSLDVELDVEEGSLSVTAGDATLSGNNSSSLSLSGTQEAINAALQTLTYTPDSDFSGEDTLEIQTADGNATETSSVDITVAPPDITLAAADDSVDIEEAGDPVIIDLLANDTFGGERDSLTVTIASTTASGISIINNNDGTVSVDPGDSYQSLLPGESAQQTLSYQLSDQDNETTSAEVIINIAGSVNNAPAHTPPNELSGDAGSEFDLGSLQVDDVDAGDSSFSINLSVDQGILTVADNSAVVSGNMSSSLTLSADLQSINALLQTLTYTPDDSFVGDDTLSISSDDGDNITADQFTLTVNPVNTPPQAQPDTLSNAQDSITTTYAASDLLANDSDDDSQDILHIVDVTGVSTLGAAVVFDAVSGAILYDPTTSQILADASSDLTDMFEYTITDGNGGLATASVQLIVTDSDTPNQKVNEYFIASAVSSETDTETNGLYSFLEFDGNSSNGSGQSWINLDALFDSLGFSDADRAAGEGFNVIGDSLFVDLDNNNSTGANGGFEYEIATITDASTVSGTFDNADVLAGTTFGL